MKGLSSYYLDYDLWVRLRQTAHALDVARTRDLNNLGLTIMEAGVLVIVKALGNNTTPSELSRRLFREPHTISHLLKSMKKKGLVKKSKDLHRKNLVRVALTAKGERLRSQAAMIEPISRATSVLSEEERRQMISQLELILHTAIEKAGKSGMPAKASDLRSDKREGKK